MKCPSCSVNLLMSEKKGVEIDYCPECRGIWLDKGELEKLIEAEKKSYDDFEKDYREERREYRNDDRRDDRYRDERDYNKKYKKRKRGGMFSEIGDIFDF